MNSFDGLISILDITEERITELLDITIETSKLKSKQKKDWKNTEQNIELWDSSEGITYR